jgi:hypothetical protein
MATLPHIMYSCLGSKNPFICRQKMAQIAENSDHNIDLSFKSFACLHVSSNRTVKPSKRQ